MSIRPSSNIPNVYTALRSKISGENCVIGFALLQREVLLIRARSDGFNPSDSAETRAVTALLKGNGHQAEEAETWFNLTWKNEPLGETLHSP